MSEAVHAVVEWLHAQGTTGLCADSRTLREGEAFIACRGGTMDARQFVESALHVASCALVEAQGWEGFPLSHDRHRVLSVDNLKARAGGIAAAFYDYPCAELPLIAFTGTNGKSSSVWWCAALISALCERQLCGMIGTLGVGVYAAAVLQAKPVSTGLTTPDAVFLQRQIRDFVRQGCDAVCMEASSIAMVEGRLNGAQLHTAVFTNFSQDHLDYHGSMENYWRAKLGLFDCKGLRAAVINLDDAQGFELRDALAQRDLDVWTVATAHPARLCAQRIVHTPGGMQFDLVEQGASPCCVQTALIGAYNINNLLGVVAALRIQGVALRDIAQAIPALGGVPGRLAPVNPDVAGLGAAPLVIVDYAHTPDALARVLHTTRMQAQLRKGRLWCVFGCGGDRDPGKRPLMGAIAHAQADHVVLTSDNPRSESPQHIATQILAGIGEDREVDVELDRARAIEYAVTNAGSADVVLLAGKGHEDYQEVLGVRHAFDDSAVARVALMLREVFSVAEAAGRICTDTRTLRRGDIFVALTGNKFDAHDYLEQAAHGGAVMAIVQRGHRGVHAVRAQGLKLHLVEVDNTLEALGAIARRHRERWAHTHGNAPVIAVTGSNGKTTLTQMIASVLRAWQGTRAHCTQGNFNNEVGVPHTLLQLQSHHTCAVIEMGMNHVGEIARLAAMSQPSVVVVNNAQREHQEFMHTVEAVAEENGAAIAALGENGVAVFPCDDAFTHVWRSLAAPRQTIEFDNASSTHATAMDSAPARVHPSVAQVHCTTPAVFVDGAWQLHLTTPGGSLSYRLRLPGHHNVKNSLAAVAACVAAGVPLESIGEGLEQFEALRGRSRLVQCVLHGRQLNLIDDSYNANPDSCIAAIDMLSQLPAPHLLVLGDMGEVGSEAVRLHAEVGGYASQKRIAVVLCLGDLARHLAQACCSAHTRAQWFASIEPLQVAVLEAARSANSILVKGSRFMHMERVVDFLCSPPGHQEVSHAA